MTKTEKYVRAHLSDELEEVEHSTIVRVVNGLTVYEKTLVYHYTKDGYAAINSELRSGHARSELSLLLEQALRKLPNFGGIVYRTTSLGRKDLDRYHDALVTGNPMVDAAFISASRSRTLERIMPRYNTRFQIVSKTGKFIEAISYNGLYSSVNEQEVLFCPGCEFEVLSVTPLPDFVFIKLEEL